MDWGSVFCPSSRFTVVSISSRFDSSLKTLKYLSFQRIEFRISFIYPKKSSSSIQDRWTTYRTEFSLYRIDFTEVYRNDQIPVSAYIYSDLKKEQRDSPRTAACTFKQTITLKVFIDCLEINSYITD